jgi:uncharacterized protein
LEELIRLISMASVDAPPEVRRSLNKGSNGLSIYEDKVAKVDAGKIIGKHGRNAAAIRTIVDAASKRNHERCIVETLE